MQLIIGNKNYSSWSLRPWLALKHANIPFEEILLPFETPNWKDEIRKYSPSGKVPALRHGDVVVVESLAICEYVAELHPEAQLWPADRALRAAARSVSCEMHAGFAELRKALWLDVSARTPKPLTSAVQADVDRVLAIWSAARGPFLFGDFSIADAMFAPVAFRFRTYGVEVPSGPAKAWYERMLALPAMKEWDAAASAEAKPESPPRPMWAVIFTSQHSSTPDALKGYGETAKVMEELARQQPGFVDIESARGTDGFGITVSYWDSLDAIAAWKANVKHRAVQERGKSHFYERYSVKVCSVEKAYGKP